jgi:hypothetical protein
MGDRNDGRKNHASTLIGNFVSKPQALAEMSEERFAEILNELQARGDKTKLMQLFGH